MKPAGPAWAVAPSGDRSAPAGRRSRPSSRPRDRASAIQPRHRSAAGAGPGPRRRRKAGGAADRRRLEPDVPEDRGHKCDRRLDRGAAAFSGPPGVRVQDEQGCACDLDTEQGDDLGHPSRLAAHEPVVGPHGEHRIAPRLVAVERVQHVARARVALGHQRDLQASSNGESGLSVMAPPVGRPVVVRRSSRPAGSGRGTSDRRPLARAGRRSRSEGIGDPRAETARPADVSSARVQTCPPRRAAASVD